MNTQRYPPDNKLDCKCSYWDLGLK